MPDFSLSFYVLLSLLTCLCAVLLFAPDRYLTPERMGVTELLLTVMLPAALCYPFLFYQVLKTNDAPWAMLCMVGIVMVTIGVTRAARSAFSRKVKPKSAEVQGEKYSL